MSVCVCVVCVSSFLFIKCCHICWCICFQLLSSIESFTTLMWSICLPLVLFLLCSCPPACVVVFMLLLCCFDVVPLLCFVLSFASLHGVCCIRGLEQTVCCNWLSLVVSVVVTVCSLLWQRRWAWWVRWGCWWKRRRVRWVGSSTSVICQRQSVNIFSMSSTRTSTSVTWKRKDYGQSVSQSM